MTVGVQAIVPLIVLLVATTWTFVDFRIHPVRDLKVLPWPARRCLYEGLVVAVVWIVTTALSRQALGWGIVRSGIGAGLGWSIATLYWSTALRQRAIDQADHGTDREI